MAEIVVHVVKGNCPVMIIGGWPTLPHFPVDDGSRVDHTNSVRHRWIMVLHFRVADSFRGLERVGV
jgi:hypothetical protein